MGNKTSDPRLISTLPLCAKRRCFAPNPWPCPKAPYLWSRSSDGSWWPSGSWCTWWPWWESSFETIWRRFRRKDPKFQTHVLPFIVLLTLPIGKSCSSITGLQHKCFITHWIIWYSHPDRIYPYALGKMLWLWEEKKVKIGRKDVSNMLHLFKMTAFEKAPARCRKQLHESEISCCFRNTSLAAGKGSPQACYGLPRVVRKLMADMKEMAFGCSQCEIVKSKVSCSLLVPVARNYF